MDDFTDAVPLAVVAVTGGPSPAALAGYLAELGHLPGVRRASVASTSGDTAFLTVTSAFEPSAAQARGTIAAIRSVRPPAGATDTLVGGQTAELVDFLHAITAALPWILLIIGLSASLLIMLAFRSLLLPLKVLAVAALSLTASFGVLVWGFQDGHLAGLMGFTPTGYISATVPVLILAIVFGLAMDYEVFLLGRIREEWLRTGDNTRAVVTGVQRTGGIITSAALLLLIVTSALATANVLPVAMIGVGLSVAIALDATLVRLILVPAAMRLMGSYNWWLPRLKHRPQPQPTSPKSSQIAS